MDNKEWAKKEVEIAIEQCDDEYYSLCAKSALKAYNCLLEDNHSGYSIILTMRILRRLVKNKCLTPINKTDFDLLSEHSKIDFLSNENVYAYRCDRMPSLKMYIYKNGDVKYSCTDTDRVRCAYEDDNLGITFYNGFVDEYINNIFPITFPYMPGDDCYMTYVDDFLLDEKNGDYDHRAIKYVVTPDGKKKKINAYFQEKEIRPICEKNSDEAIFTHWETKWVKISSFKYYLHKFISFVKYGKN